MIDLNDICVIPTQSNSFQCIIPRCIGQIITPIQIDKGLNFENEVNRENKTYTALWDTGAQNSGISESLARNLCLPKKKTEKYKSASGNFDANIYVGNLKLPNSLLIKNINLIGLKDLSEFDILIGMDIITTGTFLITNKADKTYFSFQINTEEAFFVSDIKEVYIVRK